MADKRTDPGREYANGRLADLERRIAVEYEQAARDVQEKTKRYFEDFQRKDRQWQIMVSRGEVTEQEWQNWRKNQMIVGERWERLANQLAADAHRANQMAAAMINGEKPAIYAEAYNYGTYECETGSLIETGFTLYDPHTVSRLLSDNPDMLPPPGRRVTELIAIGKDLLWNRQIIQSAALQGILQGESIPKIAERLAEAVRDSNMAAALRNARTMVTGAENAGRVDSYKRAQKMGIKLRQQWVATLDGRTRDSHIDMDGEVIEIGGEFSNGCRFPGDPQGPGREVWNCFVGETLVTTDSEIERSYKHLYKGELVTIKTAGGVNFTCTPNHPILSGRGWIPAKAIHEGDGLLVTFVGDEHGTRINPNVNHGFARFDALHKFLDELGGKRARALGVDFHGDVATTEVEIITKKGLLRSDRDSCDLEEKRELGLKGTDPLTSADSTFAEHFGSVRQAALGNISRESEALSLLDRGVGHSDVHGLGAVTNRDVILPKYAIDNLPAETMIRGELLNGLAGKVFVDKVIGVEICVSETHVYNLQTENGYYFVNSIQNGERMFNGITAIAKNCRCTLISQVEGYEIDITSPSRETSRELGGMSYEEWKRTHAGRRH